VATFFGFLLFSAPLALFFGFVIWLVPAMFFPAQMARRRPGAFGYLLTGYGLLAVLSLYLVASADHEVAPLLGTALSFGSVVFLRGRLRDRRSATWGQPSRLRSLVVRLGLGTPPPGYGMYGDPGGDVTEGGDAGDGFEDPSEHGRYRYGPTGSAPRRQPRDDELPDQGPR
jgi:hypothetical protein